MKKIVMAFTLFIVSAFSFTANAQWSFETTADIQSRYIWRGQPLGGEGLSLQPGATLSWNGLSLGVWGAYNISINQYQELDFCLSYTMLDELVTLQLTDYSFPILSSSYHYFDYVNNHVIEAGILLSIPKTNLTLALFTNIFGADAVNSSGDNVFSTYVEASYKTTWDVLKTDFDFAVGAALNGEAGYSFYGNDGFGVVNISVGATKSLEITPTLNLPVYGRIIANPVANKMFLMCGTTIEIK